MLSSVQKRSFAYTSVEASLNITVTVQNLGTVTERFAVTALANNATIGSQTVTALPPGALATLFFNWKTKNIPKGLYTISAKAITNQSETNIDNNQLLDGTVQVRFPGDVNSDGVVNIFDLVLVGSAFLTTPSSPNWNPNADINNDKTVNILDIVVVGVNFGKVDP